MFLYKHKVYKHTEAQIGFENTENSEKASNPAQVFAFPFLTDSERHERVHEHSQTTNKTIFVCEFSNNLKNSVSK